MAKSDFSCVETRFFKFPQVATAHRFSKRKHPRKDKKNVCVPPPSATFLGWDPACLKVWGSPQKKERRLLMGLP